MFGEQGDDGLIGGSGNDVLSGGDGADVLEGGSGNDTLYGGASADRFLFAEGSGQDKVNDFASGQDLLHLSGYASIEFADLDLDTAAIAGSTVIDLGLANGGAAGVDILTVANVVDLSRAISFPDYPS